MQKAALALLRRPGSQDRLASLYVAAGIPLNPRLREALKACRRGSDRPVRAAAYVASGAHRLPESRRLLERRGKTERNLARRLLGGRVDLRAPFVPRRELQQCLADCHLAAGIFGTSAKAETVIPFKVVHALAAGRAVVTADTEAAREHLSPGIDSLTCPPGDPEALGVRLREAAGDLASLAGFGRAARRTFESSFSLAACGERLARLLGELCGGSFGQTNRDLPATVGVR